MGWQADLQNLACEIIGEMRKLLKDVHKINAKGRATLNLHAYRMAVLIDLSNILEKIEPVVIDHLDI